MSRFAGTVAARVGALFAAAARRRGRWVVAALAAAAALLLWSDRRGLEARWVGHVGERTIWRIVDSGLGFDDPELPAALFRYPRLFRVRWSGWIDLDVAGTYRWRLSGSGAARLLVDGGEVVAKVGRRQLKTDKVELAAGLHRLTILFEDTEAESSLATEMRPPRGDWGPVPARALYPGRPGPLRRATRAAAGGVSSAARNAVATALAAIALLAATAPGRGGGLRLERWRRRLAAATREPGRRRALELAAVAAAGVAAGWLVFPRTGSPFGWDDVRYMDLAVFDRSLPAYLNRYAHVYLVKLFVWLAGGDPFLGARLLWSVELGFIVSALGLALRALARRLAPASFTLAVVLLFCQPLFFVRAGASVPDTTVATLVTVAVALFLNRRAQAVRRRFEWQIFAIGALTLWAVKSKELGAILLWLVLLMLFDEEGLDLAGFARRAAHWLAGAACALALLMLLDGIFLGDPLHAVRPSNLRSVGELNFAADPQMERELEGWMNVITHGKSPVAADDSRMRFMAMAVVLAALVAAHRRRSIPLRLLHLLPLVYVLLLMLIHVRATYVFLARYLYPIVPVSCLLVAAALHYLGLDGLRWRDLRRPGFFAATVAAGFLLFGIALPYQIGRLPASEFLPAGWLAGVDWTSLDAFVALVAAPALMLTLTLVLVLVFPLPRWRLLLLVTLLLLFLGLPLRRTLQDLGMSRPWQRGETNLHGLRVLGAEIPERPGVRIEVSPTLMSSSHRMFGVRETCREIVKLYLRRRDVEVTCWPVLVPEHDVAFLAAADYAYWRRLWPGLADTAVRSPGGEIVLVRPSAAPLPERE